MLSKICCGFFIFSFWSAVLPTILHRRVNLVMALQLTLATRVVLELVRTECCWSSPSFPLFFLQLPEQKNVCSVWSKRKCFIFILMWKNKHFKCSLIWPKPLTVFLFVCLLGCQKKIIIITALIFLYTCLVLNYYQFKPLNVPQLTLLQMFAILCAANTTGCFSDLTWFEKMHCSDWCVKYIFCSIVADSLMCFLWFMTCRSLIHTGLIHKAWSLSCEII